jgi:hypothetical protein
MSSIFVCHPLRYIAFYFLYFSMPVEGFFIMDALSGAASVIAVIQLAGSIVQLCGKYLNNVKNATQDIRRFQEKIAALAQVLRSLDELTRGSNGNRLTATQDLVDNIAKCSSALTNLKEKIDPETTQRGMRKWGFRAFKWPLARSEVDHAITELEWYKTIFALSLQVDQTWAPDHNPIS